MGLADIAKDLTKALLELLKTTKVETEQILVVGCSTSEVAGHPIGKNSSLEIANILLDNLLPIINEHQLYLAIQACEHLNRALVIEKNCQEKYRLEEVNVIPHEKAGGSLATAAMTRFKNPVLVENITGHLGIDIGDTFIGMHLKPVVVPVRASIKEIGFAHLTMARTRAKYIGGARAQYFN